jgi:hypothetical protein
MNARITQYVADVKKDEERLRLHKKLCIHCAFVILSVMVAVMMGMGIKVLFFTSAPFIVEITDFLLNV